MTTEHPYKQYDHQSLTGFFRGQALDLTAEDFVPETPIRGLWLAQAGTVRITDGAGNELDLPMFEGANEWRGIQRVHSTGTDAELQTEGQIHAGW